MGWWGREAQTFQKRVTHFLAEKWERQYLKLHGFVQERMALSLVRSNSLLLCGLRMKKAAQFVG